MPLIQAGNLNVHYIERGEGAPIVFIHGNWATCSWWEPVLARLPAGYRGIAYDLRGRGATEGPDSDYSIPALAGDLLAFADALGLGPFHLVGHSLGSVVAMQFALEHQDRLRSLVVVAPGWVDGMPAAFNVPEQQQALKDNPALFAQALKALVPAAPDDAFWQRLVSEGHAQRIEATLANLPALVAWTPGDALQAIGVPRLAIAGEHDALLAGHITERAAQALGTNLVVIPGVGHSPNLEAPDAFVQALLAHVSETNSNIADSR